MSKSSLYETLGELIYVMAMADGAIQEEELAAVKTMLENHAWAKDIQWSFSYEMEKQPNLEDLYKKAITACEMHGPDPEYAYFVKVMEAVAKANDGISEQEKEVMDNFVQDLTARFKSDIDRING